MNDHGYTVIATSGTLTEKSGRQIAINSFAVAPAIVEHRRCVCSKSLCGREATQEDMLCDQCREEC